MATDNYITVKEAAELLGVSDTAVRGLIERHVLPAQRLRGMIRLPRIAVMARAAGWDRDPRLNTATVAQRLGVSEQTVRNYVKRGILQVERTTKGLRFTEEALKAFVPPLVGVPARKQPYQRVRKRTE